MGEKSSFNIVTFSKNKNLVSSAGFGPFGDRSNFLWQK